MTLDEIEHLLRALDDAATPAELDTAMLAYRLAVTPAIVCNLVGIARAALRDVSASVQPI